MNSYNWERCDDPDQDCNGVTREPACGASDGKCSLRIMKWQNPPESAHPRWGPDNDCRPDDDPPF